MKYYKVVTSSDQGSTEVYFRGASDWWIDGPYGSGLQYQVFERPNVAAAWMQVYSSVS